MNLKTIFHTLRKNNHSEYILHFISNLFAFTIISAYSLLLFSPTVLEVLPVGGDSRKQAFGIFAVVCIGCMAFSFYASSLFFKKKQAELGIMIALGGNKKKLYKVVVKENLFLNLLALLAGIFLGAPINKLIWGIMHLFINTQEMKLRMNINVLVITILIAIINILISCFTLKKTIYSMEIMDVIKSEHKTEMVKSVSKHIGLYGFLLTFWGLIASFYAPSLYMDLCSAYPPEWLNLLFLIPLAGIYMILLHVVVNGFGSKKKKYKNMISKSMMVFQGKQTVNCMLVITLLIGGGCFAGFYVPVMMAGSDKIIETRKWDYQYEIPASLENFKEKELEDIVTSKGSTIEEQTVLPVLLVAGDGEREIEDGRKFSLVYNEILYTVHLLKKSDYENFTKEQLQLENNGYLAVTDAEGLGRFDEDFTKLTNMATRESVEVSFAGCLHNNDLTLNNYMLYVVNDEIYDQLCAGNTKEWMSALHYWKVNQDSYDVALEVYNALVDNFSMEYRLDSGYDQVSKIARNEEGEVYWFDEPEYENWKYLKENNAEFEREWMYYPIFKKLFLERTIQKYAVFLMLFVYIAIVALMAAWLIAYTRCITICMKNKFVFQDLEKLGASLSFRRKELRKQLLCVYKYPSILGMTVVYLFFVLILYANDGGRITQAEGSGLLVCFLLELTIGFITYLIYLGTVLITRRCVLWHEH